MTRPVERIDDILAELGKVWKRYPDMRLGQLISNAASLANSQSWHMEDTTLMSVLEHGLDASVRDLDPDVMLGDPFGPWSHRNSNGDNEEIDQEHSYEQGT